MSLGGEKGLGPVLKTIQGGENLHLMLLKGREWGQVIIPVEDRRKLGGWTIGCKASFFREAKIQSFIYPLPTG